MQERIERLRKAALLVLEVEKCGGSADTFSVAWTEFERAASPDVILALIDRGQSFPSLDSDSVGEIILDQ